MAPCNAVLAVLVVVLAAAAAAHAIDLHRQARMEELKASIRDRRPSFVFVKLRHDTGHRTLEDVQQLATRWQQGMTEGKIGANVYPLDSDTLHIALLTTAAANKVKEFVLEQDEAYEMLVGDDVVRRPGDPSLESLVHRDVWKRERMRQEMMKEREKLHLDRMGGDGGMTEHHRARIKEHLRARHVERMERKRQMREEWLENHADDDL
ncbi:hypothetical protein CLOM_g16331 [Closterium sp. NIES-68]|nr:hypothetical protein CLOM_g16331 [Closterium sp. NIES-68]GJP68995.1 hypothetical protein CLOP_g25627 [Closterium sp. NIES-67]